MKATLNTIAACTQRIHASKSTNNAKKKKERNKTKDKKKSKVNSQIGNFCYRSFIMHINCLI